MSGYGQYDTSRARSPRPSRHDDYPPPSRYEDDDNYPPRRPAPGSAHAESRYHLTSAPTWVVASSRYDQPPGSLGQRYDTAPSRHSGGRYDDPEPSESTRAPSTRAAERRSRSRYDDEVSDRSGTTYRPPPRDAAAGARVREVDEYEPSPTALRRDDRARDPPPHMAYAPDRPAQSSTAVVRRSAPAPSEAGTGQVSLLDNLQRLKLTSFYVRPGYGNEGRKINIFANFFTVRARGGTAKIIHHYDIEINPVIKVQNQKKPKHLMRAVFEQTCQDARGEWERGFVACAFDGRKNCFTPYEFPLRKEEVKTFITTIAPDNTVQRATSGDSGSDSENRRFKVEIKHVAQINLETVMEYCRADKKTPSREEECLTGIMATNVLMRDVPSKRYAQVGATGNRFFTMREAVPISSGAVVCKGFMQSFRYSNSGLPLLNLDIGFSAFLASGPALEVISKIIHRASGSGGRGGRGGGPGFGGRAGGPGGPSSAGPLISELDPFQISIIKNKLRGVKFTPMHRHSTRLHTVQSVTLQSAQDITFVIEGKDGQGDKRISIAEYFRHMYNVEVTKPRLPCVQYGKKSFIPLEFVNLADWNPLPPTKLSADQSADMIRVAAMRPKERFNAINGWRKELAYEEQEKIGSWGLEVNRDMVQVNARVLPAPKILYANGMEGRAVDGGWNLRGKRFYRKAKKPLRAWAVISFDRYCDTDDMKRYISYLVRTLQAHGVPVDNERPECIGPVDPREPANISGALRRAAQAAYQAGKCTPQLICIVLPGRDAWLYEAIKKSSFMDLKGPVPTQCMQASKIRNPRGIDAYTGNLVMKIQSKLGGVTHQIPLSELPGMERGKTMLLGADLGHPPVKAGYSDAPTVACSVATYSPDCDAYSAQIRLQVGRQEIIQELSGMVEAHLDIFASQNGGCYPERIIVFRDGISEGQYAACLQYEHNAILRACARAGGPSYRPRILICVCAKKHNTRFFGRDADVDSSGNLPSGLVVDQAVTHPYAFDFFLQAHSGRVGTARPTHYICLLDELGLRPDDLQKMVHSMCYAFARCTRSVSLVPVCYIADLVCQKARIIMHDPTAGSSARSESSAGLAGGRGAGARMAGGANALPLGGPLGGDGRPPGPGSISGRTTTSILRERNAGIDVMQLQRVLAKNPELAEVAWWM